MKIIPAIQINKNSDAETKIFQIIKKIQLDSDWVAFHSLNISEHAYKLWSEIDFIILGPKGLFCFEVKGGRVTKNDETGIWTYTDRFGKSHTSSEGPFDQVRTGTYAALDKIKKDKGIDLKRDYIFGWGVIFPNITWGITSIEMPKEIICDKKKAIDKEQFKKYLNNLIDYWTLKSNKKNNLSKKTIDEISKYFRPTFDIAPSFTEQADNLNKKFVQFTEEQYKYLDSIEENDRIICSGGAGTGKSFLAIQTAFRAASEGMNVLVTAKHPIFISSFRKSFQDSLYINKITVIDFDEILQNINKLSSVFDLIVVDEAQYVMNFEDIDVLDKVLKKGVENGKWRFFMDENAQAGILGRFEKEALTYVKQRRTLIQKLHDNCRNTNEIIKTAESLSKARIGEARLKSPGPQVEILTYKDEIDKINKMSEYLNILFNKGTNYKDIAILSFVNKNESFINKLSERWQDAIIEINKFNINSEENKILFSNIKDYKGLESNNVIIIDSDLVSFDDAKLRSFIYTGLTRAKINLALVIKAEKYVALLKN